jgi:hypothetical protein
MENKKIQPPSYEIEQILKKELPDDEKELKNLAEIIRKDLMGGIPTDIKYRVFLDSLKTIEFKLQWLSAEKANRRMFWLAIMGNIIAIVSVIISYYVR